MPELSEKIDPRIIKTKEAIHEVFKKMVCEMRFEKITIKAITEAARINRNTFYLHYDCVDDVLAEIQAKHSSEYSEIISKIDYMKDTAGMVRAFFEYMESQDEFFKKITCDSRFDYIRERMQNKVTDKAGKIGDLGKLDEPVRNILLAYNNTVLYLYRQWVADGRKVPMEKMIGLATTLLENGMKGFIGI